MTSETIRRDLAGMNERREKLEDELRAANETNASAQQALLLSASQDATEAATLAFARAGALREGLATLTAQIEAKEQELTAAETSEAQAALRARKAECETEIDQALTEYRQGRIDAHTTLVSQLTPTIAAWDRFKALRFEYSEISKQLGEASALNIGRVDGIENLPLGYWIDQAAQHLGRLAERKSPAERKALITKRSKSREETAKRLDQKRAENERKAREQRLGFAGAAARNPLRKG